MVLKWYVDISEQRRSTRWNLVNIRSCDEIPSAQKVPFRKKKDNYCAVVTVRSHRKSRSVNSAIEFYTPSLGYLNCRHQMIKKYVFVYYKLSIVTISRIFRSRIFHPLQYWAAFSCPVLFTLQITIKWCRIFRCHIFTIRIFSVLAYVNLKKKTRKYCIPFYTGPTVRLTEPFQIAFRWGERKPARLVWDWCAAEYTEYIRNSVNLVDARVRTLPVFMSSIWYTHTHTHARTHTHTFNGPLSGTTQSSR